MNMHRPDPLARRLTALVEENETLREENRQLRQLLAPTIRTPREWRLTQNEERFLSALRAAGTRTVSRERALVATCDREDDLPEPQVLSVWASRIRTKLKRAGLPPAIEAALGEGYRLTPEGLASVNAAISRTLKAEADAGGPAGRA